MFRLHMVCGLILAPIVALTGLSGSAIVYKPEIDRLSAGAMTKVRATDDPRPLSNLYRLTIGLVPGETIERLYLWGKDEAWTFRVRARSGSRRYLYVDQYRAKLLGQHAMDGTLPEWIYELHTSLATGRWGELVVGITGLATALMCLTGAIVWWPGAGRIGTGFRYHPRARWKGKTFDLHKITGASFLVVIFIVAVTGASYEFPKTYQRLAALVAGTPSPRSAHSIPRPGYDDVDLDEIYNAALRAIPGAELKILAWPKSPDDPFAARMKLPGDWSQFGQQYVYIDSYTAQVIRVDLLRHLPVGLRIMKAIDPLHYGTFGGHVTRMLWVIGGFAIAGLSITGWLLWWNRPARERSV